MELYTDHLMLKTVTDSDIDEVARMWKYEKGSISPEDARRAIAYMQNNHKRNRHGSIYHLCFAVFEKNERRIIGWCGLDGKCSPGQTVLFYTIGQAYRNKGYATQCAAKLFEYAFETAGLPCIHGGCHKHNIASFRVMEKAGMVQNGFSEDGGPQFYIDKTRYDALK